jgi:hypothetical protein
VGSQGQSFLAHALFQATVATEAPDFVIDDVESRLVVSGGKVFRGHGKPDGIRYALTK